MTTASNPVVMDPTQPVPDAVIGGDDSKTTDEDTAVSGDLTVTDTNAGQASFVPQADMNGQYGKMSITGNGHWTYTPDDRADHLAVNASVQEKFTVTSADGTTHQILVTVTGTNDAPVVTHQTISGTEDHDYTMSAADFGYSDIEGEALDHVKITSLPDAAHGQLMLGTTAVTAGQEIPASEISHLVFHPAPDFHGDVDFKYTVSDGLKDSPESSGTISMASSIDQAAVSGSGSGNADTDIALNIQATEHGGDTLHHVVISNLPAGAVLSAGTDDGSGNWHVDKGDLANLKITPPQGFNGHIDLQVTGYTTDGAATQAGSAQTVGVDVAAKIDHAPVIETTQFVTHVQQNKLTGSVGATDQDAGDTHRWSVVNPDGGHSAQRHGQYGTFAIDPLTGDFTYSPDGSGGSVQKSGAMPPPGQVADTFVISVTDSTGLSQQMAVEVMVETNAQHVHGNSGHWVAHIVPVGAHLDPSTVSADEPLEELGITDTGEPVVEETKTEEISIHLGDKDEHSAAEGVSGHSADIDPLKVVHGDAADGHHDAPPTENGDPGLAGLLHEEAPLSFDNIGVGMHSGTVMPSNTDDMTSAGVGSHVQSDGDLPEHTGAEQPSLAGDADKKDDTDDNLKTKDIIGDDRDTSVDALLVNQPEKEPVPVDESAVGAGNAAETADKAGADVAPDSTTLDSNLVDQNDDQL